MNHTDLLKRAFNITWRYRPLWIFGFLLALCGGGGGGGGGGNFNFPSSSSGDSFGDFEDLSGIDMPTIDTNIIIAVGVGLFCLVILLVVLSVVVQMVTRTALIGMVRQIKENETTTVADGWRLGWSGEAWRLFLLNLLIGIPLTILSLFLLLLAFSPLLFLIVDETALTVVSIILTVLAVIFVILILFLVGVVITPFQKLAGRRTVLENRGVVDSLRDAFGLVKHRFKDVAIIWLLMVGIGFGWGIVTLVLVLPVSLLAAAVIGGIPAGLVYLISNSIPGAAIAGIPLALLTLIFIITAASAFYLIYQSTLWTLAYLEIQEVGNTGQQAEETPAPNPNL